jgi:4-methyl-5(b-hydroxyethyl)-thiazole monophosphate biosynthesis
MSKTVLVPVADGTEELEAVAVIDVLRRAEAHVTVGSVAGPQIVASRGTKIIADALISQCAERAFDLIVLPGGMPGSEYLRDCPQLIDMLREQKRQTRLYGAICAAPAVVLAHHGLLGDLAATCHPAFSSRIENKTRMDSRVVVDGNCITSRGAGTAVEFALNLVALLYGREKALAVASPMLARFDFAF